MNKKDKQMLAKAQELFELLSGMIYTFPTEKLSQYNTLTVYRDEIVLLNYKFTETTLVHFYMKVDTKELGVYRKDESDLSSYYLFCKDESQYQYVYNPLAKDKPSHMLANKGSMNDISRFVDEVIDLSGLVSFNK